VTKVNLHIIYGVLKGIFDVKFKCLKVESHFDHLSFERLCVGIGVEDVTSFGLQESVRFIKIESALCPLSY